MRSRDLVILHSSLDRSIHIECKMRFPEDVTVLTGIKNWHQPDSQLTGAPTLPTVNASVLAKIIEWKMVVEEISARQESILTIGVVERRFLRRAPVDVANR